MAKKTINVDIEINTKKAEETVSKFGKFMEVEDTLIANFYKHSGNVIDKMRAEGEQYKFERQIRR